MYNTDIRVSKVEEYTPRRDPKKIVAVAALAVIVLVAGVAVLNTQLAGRTTLKVYTYGSFMMWGDDPSTIDEVVFGPFEEQYGVDVEIVRLPTDASGVLSRLMAEADNPVADVVIGIDNIQVLQRGSIPIDDVMTETEIADIVFEPYTPADLDLIDQELIDALDPEHRLLPFDFGLVTLVYQQSTINVTTHPELANLTFADLATPGLASALVTENPHESSPGLSFLLTEIAVQEKLVGTDWRQWWSDVKGLIDVQPGWDEAWSVWDSDPSRHLLVSYGTDPAYSSHYLNGSAPDTAVATVYYNGAHYAWMQVEGIGLVKGAPHPDLARAFIDYCLTGAVQAHIALNQWMYPANMHVELPSVYQYALHPDDVELLNSVLTRSDIAADLTGWLSEWDEIMVG